MIKSRKTILNRAYLIGALLLVLFIGVGVKLLSIQINEKDNYKDNIAEYTIPAKRGNLYASDGTLLATTVTKYNVAIDFKTFYNRTNSDTIDFYKNALADSLAKVFKKKSKQEYLRLFAKQKTKKSQYIPLFKDLNYGEIKRLRNFPMFKGRKSTKSGLIVSERNERVVINNKWSRTIGRVENGRKIGLEGAYTEFLQGKNGKELRINVRGKSRPLNDESRVEPQDGYDVITTIDPAIQDVAYNGLLKELEHYSADHGSVVVMEVETGEVKALVNLSRDKKGNYRDIRNYAIAERTETGSTFKLMSLMACLDDGVADTATVKPTGTMSIHNAKVRDSNGGRGYGEVSMMKIFEKSSNVGTVRFVYDNYKEHPEDFVNRLYKWKLHQKLGLDIQGEREPLIPHPDNKESWSGLSLPWMAYGYGVELTPIQILTFYNAVANNGKMVKPLFLKETRSGGKIVESYEPEIINPSIASEATIKKAQAMLRGVVEHGTGRALNTAGYSIAGKTGTCQTGYGSGNVQYIASFCGYFPADNPRYSAIVTVTEPDKSKGYYGGLIAGPVFKGIARRVYVNTPERNLDGAPQLVDVEKEILKEKDFDFTKKISSMPNLVNEKGGDAIALLENAGLKVDYKGVGSVVKQSLKPGVRIKKGQHVTLILN
ncbi:penicillin-binding protein [Flavobacteriaceae bacterium UJ101]|nr:penicillin-binding protein [Flavobacteriaceae bacterium UJ101]